MEHTVEEAPRTDSPPNTTNNGKRSLRFPLFVYSLLVGRTKPIFYLFLLLKQTLSIPHLLLTVSLDVLLEFALIEL